MYEAFTDLARKVMQAAEQEAVRAGCEYLQSEHILLSMLAIEECAAARILLCLHDRNKIKAAVKRGMRPSNVGSVGRPCQRPRAKRAIELAIEESQSQERPYVGTEHLLLGLLREGETPVGNVLKDLGITHEKVLNLAQSLDGPEGNLLLTPPEQFVVLTPELTHALAVVVDGTFSKIGVTAQDAAGIIRLLGSDCPDRRVFMATMEMFRDMSRLVGSFDVLREK